jgi:hypothetical protein
LRAALVHGALIAIWSQLASCGRNDTAAGYFFGLALSTNIVIRRVATQQQKHHSDTGKHENGAEEAHDGVAPGGTRMRPLSLRKGSSAGKGPERCRRSGMRPSSDAVGFVICPGRVSA